jgi:MFS family permease
MGRIFGADAPAGALFAPLFITLISALAINVVPVALPAIGQEFSMSDSRTALVMTAFAFPSIFALPLVGIISDTYGRRSVAIPSLLVFGLTGVGILFVDSFWGLLLIRGIQGSSFAGTLPFTITMIGDLYTGNVGSSVQGVRSGIAGVANTIAPILSGVLVTIAWEYTFTLFVLAIPAAGLTYWLYPETADLDRTTRSDTVRISNWLRSRYRSVSTEVRNRSLGILLGAGLVTFFIKQGVRTFVPLYAVSQLNLAPATVGLILGGYGFVRVLISPLAGPLVARSSRRIMMLGLFIVIAGATVSLPLAKTETALGLVVVIYAIGEAVLNPFLADSVASFTRDSTRGTIVSFFSTLRSIANTTSPVLLGAILAFTNFQWVFIVTGAIGFLYLGIVGVYFYPQPTEFQ